MLLAVAPFNQPWGIGAILYSLNDIVAAVGAAILPIFPAALARPAVEGTGGERRTGDADGATG